MKTSLQLEGEIALHKTGWVAQRTGWIILLLLLIAASIGIFGNGWLSKKQLTDKDIRITYERFARFESPMKLILESKITNRNAIEVKIPYSYLNLVDIEKIVPEPERRKISGNAVIFTFATDGPAMIRFNLTPEAAGSIETHLTINDTRFTISHYIYP